MEQQHHLEEQKEKNGTTESDSLFGLFSTGASKENTPEVLALEAPVQPKNNTKTATEGRLNELELELHKEKEKALKYEILLKERENARLEMEHLFKTMKEQLKEEKLEQNVETELSSARTRVDSLEKRLDEMNQLFLRALKEQKAPADNVASSIMFQNLVSRLEDMVLAAQDRIEHLEEETIQTKEKALKSEIMLRKLEGFYPQMEEALAKTQNDNLKDVAGVRQEAEKTIRDVKEDLVKHVDMLRQEQEQKIEKLEKNIKENALDIRRDTENKAQDIKEWLTKNVNVFQQEIGQLKEDIKNTETGAKQLAAETVENFRVELAGMHQRFEDMSCQLANAYRKAEDNEKTLAKTQDDNLREIVSTRAETDNVVNSIKEELKKDAGALKQEISDVRGEITTMVQSVKETAMKDAETLRQEIGQFKKETNENEVAAKQHVEETAENIKRDLADVLQRFEVLKRESMKNGAEEFTDIYTRLDNFNEKIAAFCSQIKELEEKSIKGTENNNNLQIKVGEQQKTIESLSQELLSNKEEFKFATNAKTAGIEKQIAEIKAQLPGALNDSMLNMATWLESIFKIVKNELQEYIYILDSEGNNSHKLFCSKNELVTLMTKINIEIGRLRNEFNLTK